MHHQLIGISDLIHLTTGELRELEARLRHILENEAGLTDRDITVIIASLANIRTEKHSRHFAKLTAANLQLR